MKLKQNLSSLFKVLSVFVLFLVFSMYSKNENVSAAVTESDTPIKEIHEKMVELELVTLNQDGKAIITDIFDVHELLGINEKQYNEYLEFLESANYLVEEGSLSFSGNLEISLSSAEEVHEASFNSERTSIDDSVSTFAIPEMDLVGTVEKNRAELKKYYQSQLDMTRYFPGYDAYTPTVGWWVGKVKPGGVWDYKSQPGSYPYYTQWYARTYNGYEILTSEYIGNYNYGYTGEYLFSLNVLLTAGDVVSIITSFMDSIEKREFKLRLDDESDKIPVRRGYNNAVSYGK